jgi:cardiolipin synthase
VNRARRLRWVAALTVVMAGIWLGPAGTAALAVTAARPEPSAAPAATAATPARRAPAAQRVLPADVSQERGPLATLIEPGAGMAPIYELIGSARHGLDMTMYELADPTAEAELAGDAARGVDVRVLLDQNRERSRNAAAFAYLSAHGVHVRWAPAQFAATHEKDFTVDGKVTVICTLNLTSEYYSTSRDACVFDREPRDVAAVSTVFNSDWSAHPITAMARERGTDLLWSPGSEQALVDLIGSARHSVLFESEEISDWYIADALESAAKRGVSVTVVMTRESQWDSRFDELATAGAHVYTYSYYAPIYIHMKAIVVDSREAYVGSINASVASTLYNRELGLVTASPAVVGPLQAAIVHDARGASSWQG